MPLPFGGSFHRTPAKGLTGGGGSSSGTGADSSSSGTGASSSGTGAGGSSGTVAGGSSGAGDTSGSVGSVEPREPRHARAAMPEHIKEALSDPKDFLETVKKTTLFDCDTDLPIPEGLKSEVMQQAQKNLPHSTRIPNSVTSPSKAFDY